jgi:OOP family OmpA-OmpF porin
MNLVISALALVAFVACAGRPLPDQAPVAVDPVKMKRDQWREIDQLFVVADASGTMYMEESFPEAKALSRSFIQSLPDKSERARNDTYNVSAIAFGGDDRQVAPLQGFNRSALESEAAKFQVMGAIDGRGGETPFHAVFTEIEQSLQGQRGKTAVVIFSDGVPDDPERALGAAQALADSRKADGLCFHGVQTGDDPAGREFLNALAQVNGCGSVRPAENLRTASAISSFTSGVVSGTAPQPPAVAAGMPCEGMLRLRGVEFAFDSDNITQSSEVILDVAAEELSRCPGRSINVDGHTDSTGPEAYNVGLSRRRAVSVQNYLERKGVGGARLDPRGMGEASPVASNETEDGRTRNRRVELIAR